MEKQSSSKTRDKEGSERKNQSLIQQFEDLEKEWKLLQVSKPRNQRRCSTGSDCSSSILTLFDNNLLHNSPRGLMSSLQRDRSPFHDDGFIVKNCSMAVEEILRDRRAAIMSGKLKGRRLFGAEEEAKQVELDLNYDEKGGMSNDCKQSCSFSDSCLSEEKVMVMEEEKTVVVVEVVEKRGHGSRRLRGGGGCMTAMAWFAFVLIFITVGLISIRCNGKSLHEYDLTLVPT